MANTNQTRGNIILLIIYRFIDVKDVNTTIVMKSQKTFMDIYGKNCHTYIYLECKLDFTIQTNLRDIVSSYGNGWFEKVRSERFVQVILTIMDSENYQCLNKEVVINLESEAFNVTT